MCNPAEQAGVDYASDPKRINALVSEMDNLVICADTSANASIGTNKAIDNHSNGSLVEINEAVAHLSSDSLIEAHGVGDHHSLDTSEHSPKEVLISGNDSQEAIEGMDQTREPSMTCIAKANSFAEVDGIVQDGIQIPNFHFKETSGHTCNSNLVKFEDDMHSVSAEYRRVETKHMESEILLENMSSETKSSQIEEVKFEEEALLETSKESAGELVTLAGLSDRANGQTSIKVVEALDSTSGSGGNDSAAEELLIDPRKGAEKPETQTDMGHADDKVEVDDPSLLEGLAGGSEGKSTGPCTETNGVMVVKNYDLSSDAKEHFSIDFDESLASIEMRPGLREGVAKQIASSSEESGVVKITMTCEETENGTAVGSPETQNTPQQFEQMMKGIVVTSEHVETSIPTMAMSYKEDAVEHVPRTFKEANEETLSEIEQGPIVSSVEVHVTDTAVLKGNSRPELAEFFNDDAAEHVPKSFKEATPSEIEQEGTTLSSVPVHVTDTTVLNGNSRTELVEFFSNARGLKLEKEIEEQEYAPVLAKSPLKKKLFMESPRSLRVLLFSEETPTKKDEKQKKDFKVMEFSSKVAPAAESHDNENRMEHNYPAKWYQNVDNEETSSAFSEPIAFSGALTYQGLTSYSGQVPYSGSISHRSDSSTSTRSFAFPILASDWNSSPVKMDAPDPLYYRQRRKWHFCFCCSRPSTLYE